MNTIKYLLIAILATSAYANQNNEIDVFYDPFYYDDINKLLDIREGSIIDEYKFGKVKNNGTLSNESLIQEIEKRQKELEQKIREEQKIVITPREKVIVNQDLNKSRENFLESIDDRFDKIPNIIEDDKTGEKIKSNVEVIRGKEAIVENIKLKEVVNN